MFLLFEQLMLDEAGGHSELQLNIFKACDINDFIILFIHACVYTYYEDVVSR